MSADAQAPSQVKIVVVGDVDHGKSTIVGRLIYETGSLPEGKFEAVKAMSARRGMPFEWAFLLDALQAERDQGVTIDTTQIRFRIGAREFVLIDAPGHREFLKNMVTGAANADAAIIVVDAEAGVEEQTRRHSYLLHLLGVRHVVGIVNKMDRVAYAATRFHAVADDLLAHLKSLDLDPVNIVIVPASARQGDNIAQPSPAMSWFTGPTLVAALRDLPAAVAALDLPLRLSVQDVYKFDERRIIAGRVESGRLRVGDLLVFSPSDKVARVHSIESWATAVTPTVAAAGQSIGITLDEPIFVERGQVATHQYVTPIVTNRFRARLFWLGHNPVKTGNNYLLKMLTGRFEARVEKIERVIDTDTLTARAVDAVQRNEVGEIVLRTRAAVPVDPFSANPRTGRFVLVEDFQIVGGGIVDAEGLAEAPGAGADRLAAKSTNITLTRTRIELADRWLANGHKSGILWLTGLSGSGKTTLAHELERHLFRKGCQVAVLDGDNLRHGLNADLAFSAADRTENIRRAGEVAALFARAGILVITAFISPYRADRDRIREAHPDLFHEMFLAASVEDCERRDPKGLYAKARAGKIAEFTGVSAPYEVPAAPDLRLDTGRETVEQCLATLVDYFERHFRIQA
jgi:bifunctional enzyme CysN/CysC